MTDRPEISIDERGRIGGPVLFLPRIRKEGIGSPDMETMNIINVQM